MIRRLRAEITYDLVMEDDMDFSEGCYRLPGEAWRVVILSKRDVPEPVIVASVWASGVEGLHIQFPRHRSLNRASIELLLTTALGVDEWVEVRGPDSIVLR